MSLLTPLPLLRFLVGVFEHDWIRRYGVSRFDMGQVPRENMVYNKPEIARNRHGGNNSLVICSLRGDS